MIESRGARKGTRGELVGWALPTIFTIIKVVCEHYDMGKAKSLFTTKRRTNNEAKSIAIYLFRSPKGKSLKNIGRAFSFNSYSTMSSIIERYKVRMPTDRGLSHRVKRLREFLMRQGQT